MEDITTMITQQNGIVDGITGSLQNLKTRISTLRQNHEGSDTEVKSIVEGINGKLANIKEMINNAKETEKKHEVKEQEREKLAKDHEEAQKKLVDLNTAKEQAEENARNTQSQLANTQAAQVANQQQVQQLQGELEKIGQIRDAQVGLTERIQSINNAISEIDAELGSLENTQKQQMDDLKTNLTALNQELQIMIQSTPPERPIQANEQMINPTGDELANLLGNMSEGQNTSPPERTNKYDSSFSLGENNQLTFNGYDSEYLNKNSMTDQNARQSRGEINSEYQRILQRDLTDFERTETDNKFAKMFWEIHPEQAITQRTRRYIESNPQRAVRDRELVGGRRRRRKTRKGRKSLHKKKHTTKRKRGGYIAVSHKHSSKGKTSSSSGHKKTHKKR